MKIRFAKKIYIAAATFLVAVGAIVALNVTGTDSQAVSAAGTRRDCTAEDIIYCGALSQTELLQKYDQNDRDTQAVFAHFGISRNDLAGQTSTVKMGKLKTNGTIVVDGKTVATNAQSTYRIRTKPQAQTFTVNGKTYYQLPVNGVYYLEADVFVLFKNGKFYTAVQSSCGNIIPAIPKEEPKPEPKPVYACESLKATRIDRDSYKFTAAASAQNGATISSYTYSFGDGKSETSTDSTIEHTYAHPGNYSATLTVNFKVDGQNKAKTGVNCKVTVKVEEEPQEPVYACESLKASKINRDTYQFIVAASTSNGAKAVSYNYDFGDGKTTTSEAAQVNHTYAQPGSYIATATVNVEVGGKTIVVPGANCRAVITVDVKPQESNPSIEIDKTVNGKEHVKVGINTEFTYEITVRNTGNVALKDAVVTDTAPSQVSLISASAGTVSDNTWIYTIPDLKVSESKQFVIKAKYTAYASGIHENTVCVETPTVPGTNPDDCDEATTETNEPIEVCDLTDNTVKTIERSEYDESTMTTDLSKCGEIEVCIVEDKVIKVIAKSEYNEATMTTDMSKCEETPITPPELPKTGMEMFIGGGLGLGSISAAGYYWTASRRSLLNALLNR